MNFESRIKELMIQCGMPDSKSVMTAMFQLANEVEYKLTKDHEINSWVWANEETSSFWEWLIEEEALYNACIGLAELHWSAKDLGDLLQKDIINNVQIETLKLFHKLLKPHIDKIINEIDFQQIAEYIILVVKVKQM
jgi:hypothetical protein